MAAINFPDNPTVGDTFIVGTREWEWSGSAWVSVSAAVGPQGPEGPPGDVGNFSATSPITFADETISLDYNALVIDGGTA